MNNFKNIFSVYMVPGAILSIVLILWCLAPYTASAVSADKGNFVILGREGKDANGNKQIIDEKIPLYIASGANETVQAKVKSGTVVLVLDKKTAQGKNFYIVSTVGKDGGMMGWVSEDYIYEITTEPVRE